MEDGLTASCQKSDPFRATHEGLHSDATKHARSTPGRWYCYHRYEEVQKAQRGRKERDVLTRSALPVFNMSVGQPLGDLRWSQPAAARYLHSTAFLALCRRYAWFIAAWIAVWMVIATVVLLILRPMYSAQAELVLDTRVQHVSDYQSVMSGPLTMADPSPTIRSEAQSLKRDSLALHVIRTLELSKNPEFQDHSSFRMRLSTFLTFWGNKILPQDAAQWLTQKLNRPSDPNSREAALIRLYLRRLSVKNDGRSFTMGVSFIAYDPELAAKVANTHVRVYLEEQRALKQGAGERAQRWLKSELGRLGEELKIKESNLRDFQEKSGLIEAQGSTLIAQQTAQMSQELSQARADLAQKEARLAEIHASGARPEVQAAVLGSSVIQGLRNLEVDLARTLVVLQSRYDSTYPPVQQTRAQIAEVRSKIIQETARIIANATTEVLVGRARIASLTSSLGKLQSQLLAQYRSDWQLKEMERDVSAERSVYRDLLSREQQLAAQTGIEEADARLISPALVPAIPYFPTLPLPLSLTFILAASSGVGIAAWRNRPGIGIERLEEVNELSHIKPFQSIPLVSPRNSGGRSLPDYLLEAPRSEFADAIRVLRGDIMLTKSGHPSHVLAITSAVPGEGKTTVALSLARSMAMMGLQILLIDGDLRRQGIAKLARVHQRDLGIVSVLGGTASLENAVVKDPLSSLDLLMPEQRITAPPDVLWGPALERMMEAARTQYDFVIIDTPPEGAVSDALLLAAYVDSTVLVIKWRKTPLSAVIRTAKAFERRGLPLAGIFLNAVDRGWLARRYDQERIYRSIRRYYVNS